LKYEIKVFQVDKHRRWR